MPYETLRLLLDVELAVTAASNRSETVLARYPAGIPINDQGVNDEPHVPFRGVKASGMGRYNSDTTIDEMTDLKWISFQIEPRRYPF